MKAATNSRHQSGVALIAVLLLLAGLIAVATAVVTLSAAQRRAAQRAEQADAYKALLDAALRVAMAEIAYPKPGNSHWYPIQTRTVVVAGERISVTLEREAGRIDLNSAQERFLTAALVTGGLEEAEARIGTARIQDWIDADDKPRPEGAERQNYAAAGLTYEPRNAPFESVDEVRQVLGLQELSDESLSAFTVYSQMHEPSANDAPVRVKEALSWLDKTAGMGQAPQPVTIAPSTEAMGGISYAGSVVRLIACHESDIGERCREVVQRLTGSASTPHLMFVWRWKSL